MIERAPRPTLDSEQPELAAAGQLVRPIEVQEAGEPELVAVTRDDGLERQVHALSQNQGPLWAVARTRSDLREVRRGAGGRNRSEAQAAFRNAGDAFERGVLSAYRASGGTLESSNGHRPQVPGAFREAFAQLLRMPEADFTALNREAARRAAGEKVAHIDLTQGTQAEKKVALQKEGSARRNRRNRRPDGDAPGAGIALTTAAEAPRPKLGIREIITPEAQERAEEVEAAAAEPVDVPAAGVRSPAGERYDEEDRPQYTIPKGGVEIPRDMLSDYNYPNARSSRNLYTRLSDGLVVPLWALPDAAFAPRPHVNNSVNHQPSRHEAAPAWQAEDAETEAEATAADAQAIPVNAQAATSAHQSREADAADDGADEASDGDADQAAAHPPLSAATREFFESYWPREYEKFSQQANKIESDLAEEDVRRILADPDAASRHQSVRTWLATQGHDPRLAHLIDPTIPAGNAAPTAPEPTQGGPEAGSAPELEHPSLSDAELLEIHELVRGYEWDDKEGRRAAVRNWLRQHDKAGVNGEFATDDWADATVHVAEIAARQARQPELSLTPEQSTAVYALMYNQNVSSEQRYAQLRQLLTEWYGEDRTQGLTDFDLWTLALDAGESAAEQRRQRRADNEQAAAADAQLAAERRRLTNELLDGLTQADVDQLTQYYTGAWADVHRNRNQDSNPGQAFLADAVVVANGDRDALRKILQRTPYSDLASMRRALSGLHLDQENGRSEAGRRLRASARAGQAAVQGAGGRGRRMINGGRRLVQDLRQYF